MKKKLLAFLLLFSSVFTAKTINAKEDYTWKSNSIGWWYENSDGSYVVNQWKEISGKWYYFNNSGYMAKSQWVGDYYLDSDGAMLVDTTTPDGYKVDSNGKWIKSSNSLYKVLSVKDGDTIVVDYNGNKETVRLIGIDTPESVHPDKSKNTNEGKLASEFTKSQLTNKSVELEFDVQKRDKYSRLLAYVYLDGKMFNETLLEKGYAKIATYPPNVKYVERFKNISSSNINANTNSQVAQWKRNSIGWWYENSDGSYVVNQWKKISGKWYYFNSSGYMAESQWVGDYYLGSDGAMLVNTTTPDGYRVDSSGKWIRSSNTQSSKPSYYGKIKGNIRTKIYHLPGGSYYNRISEKNIVWFNTPEEAENAGYRRSKR